MTADPSRVLGTFICGCGWRTTMLVKLKANRTRVCPECSKRTAVCVGLGSRSKMADKWLLGKRVLEIGAGGHNSYHLDTVNLDCRTDEAPHHSQDYGFHSPVSAPIHVLGQAVALPFEDDAFDGILASHVLEHIWDPILALQEWARVASLLAIVVPRMDLTDDEDETRTTLELLVRRHGTADPRPPGRPLHVSFWMGEDLLELVEYCGLRVLDSCDPDDKMGNGVFCIVGRV